jgi:hypothetical protein
VPELRARGEEAEVRIDAGRRAVVVAGAHVNVAPHGVPLAAHDERDLGVGLQALDAVGHVDAGALEGPGPLDVLFLVEPRLELHEHGDCFPFSAARASAATMGESEPVR